MSDRDRVKGGGRGSQQEEGDTERCQEKTAWGKRLVRKGPLVIFLDSHNTLPQGALAALKKE